MKTFTLTYRFAGDTTSRIKLFDAVDMQSAVMLGYKSCVGLTGEELQEFRVTQGEIGR